MDRPLIPWHCLPATAAAGAKGGGAEVAFNKGLNAENANKSSPNRVGMINTKYAVASSSSSSIDNLNPATNRPLC